MFARLLCGVAVSALVCGSALAQTAAPAASGDPVVAKVDGADIKKSDVMRAISNLSPQVQQQVPPQVIFPAMVDQLINAKLVAGAGRAEHLQDDPEVKEKLKQAEDRYIEEVYIARAVDARITPAALQDKYKKYLSDNPPQDEVKAAHILVASEDEAKDIIKQLKAGGDFAKLAKEKSTDKTAAAQGGDLGYFTKDQMVEPFSKAAFEMKPGQISDTPVKTQFGWHVIKVEDRRKASPPSFDDVKDDLKSQLSETMIAQVVDDLRAKAKVEKFDADGKPAASPPPAGLPVLAPEPDKPAAP